MLALTRPDGVLFAAAYPVTVMILLRSGGLTRSLRAAALSTVTFIVPASALLWWRHQAFGLWVPHTAVAKGQTGVPPDWTQRFSELAISSGGWVLLFGGVAGVLAAAVVWRDRRSRGVGLAMIMTLMLTTLAYAGLRHDWMG